MIGTGCNNGTCILGCSIVLRDDCLILEGLRWQLPLVRQLDKMGFKADRPTFRALSSQLKAFNHALGVDQDHVQAVASVCSNHECKVLSHVALHLLDQFPGIGLLL